MSAASLNLHFSSDNVSGVHPEVFQAMAEANNDDAAPYGADSYTQEFNNWVRNEFGPEAYGLPVFNGTGANIASLKMLTPAWGSVLCADTAHVFTSEGTAAAHAGL